MPIQRLRPLFLAFDHQAGWQMLQHHTAGNLVDILSARPARTHEGFFQIIFADAKPFHGLPQIVFFHLIPFAVLPMRWILAMYREAGMACTPERMTTGSPFLTNLRRESARSDSRIMASAALA